MTACIVCGDLIYNFAFRSSFSPPKMVPTLKEHIFNLVHSSALYNNRFSCVETHRASVKSRSGAAVRQVYGISSPDMQITFIYAG